MALGGDAVESGVPVEGSDHHPHHVNTRDGVHPTPRHGLDRWLGQLNEVTVLVGVLGDRDVTPDAVTVDGRVVVGEVEGEHDEPTLIALTEGSLVVLPDQPIRAVRTRIHRPSIVVHRVHLAIIVRNHRLDDCHGHAAPIGHGILGLIWVTVTIGVDITTGVDCPNVEGQRTEVLIAAHLETALAPVDRQGIQRSLHSEHTRGHGNVSHRVGDRVPELIRHRQLNLDRLAHGDGFGDGDKQLLLPRLLNEEILLELCAEGTVRIAAVMHGRRVLLWSLGGLQCHLGSPSPPRGAAETRPARAFRNQALAFQGQAGAVAEGTDLHDGVVVVVELLPVGEGSHLLVRIGKCLDQELDGSARRDLGILTPHRSRCEAEDRSLRDHVSRVVVEGAGYDPVPVAGHIAAEQRQPVRRAVDQTRVGARRVQEPRSFVDPLVANSSQELAGGQNVPLLLTPIVATLPGVADHKGVGLLVQGKPDVRRPPVFDGREFICITGKQARHRERVQVQSDVFPLGLSRVAGKVSPPKRDGLRATREGVS